MSRSPRRADDDDPEFEGILQKKTTKGFYVNRYFATRGHHLEYWSDKAAFETGDKPSESFDICDITNISKVGGKNLLLCFMNDKFKLDLKAHSSEFCAKWREFLRAKRRLYSVSELLADVDTSRLVFATKTFRCLAVLKERDQNQWLMDRMDDIFQVSNYEEDSRGSMLRNDTVLLLRSAKVALLDFVATCDECVVELAARNPRITAVSRDLARRYADLLKGRLSLELLCVQSIRERDFASLGENALCAAIEVAVIIEERLSAYSFLSHDLVPALTSTLFNSGQLISALINQSIHRMDAFIESLKTLEPPQRSVKINEVQKVLLESLAATAEHFQSFTAAPPAPTHISSTTTTYSNCANATEAKIVGTDMRKAVSMKETCSTAAAALSLSKENNPHSSSPTVKESVTGAASVGGLSSELTHSLSTRSETAVGALKDGEAREEAEAARKSAEVRAQESRDSAEVVDTVFRPVLSKIITSQLLAFADHLQMLEFHDLHSSIDTNSKQGSGNGIVSSSKVSSTVAAASAKGASEATEANMWRFATAYSESSLKTHITACDNVMMLFSSSCVQVQPVLRFLPKESIGATASGTSVSRSSSPTVTGKVGSKTDMSIDYNDNNDSNDSSKSVECTKEGIGGKDTGKDDGHPIGGYVSGGAIRLMGGQKREEDNFRASLRERVVVVEISPAVVDALCSACFASSRRAAIQLVQNVRHSADELVSSLLVEGRNERQRNATGWIGGKLCYAFIHRFELWVNNVCEEIPEKFTKLLYVETGRLLIELYIGNMVAFHRTGTSKLSSEGKDQLQHDLLALLRWFLEQEQDYQLHAEARYADAHNARIARAATAGTATASAVEEGGAVLYKMSLLSSAKLGGNSGCDIGRKKARRYCVTEEDFEEESALLLALGNFLNCSEEEVLHHFSDAVVKFGLQYAMHIYDLLRLALKFRNDIAPRARRNLLALCTEFHRQISAASALDGSLLSGFRGLNNATTTRVAVSTSAAGAATLSSPGAVFGGKGVPAMRRRRLFMDVCILDRLCPAVGRFHCTGKKWAMEVHSDPAAVKLPVAMLVSQTCADSRAWQLQRLSTAAPFHASASLPPLSSTSLEKQAGDGNDSVADSSVRRSAEICAARDGNTPEVEASTITTVPANAAAEATVRATARAVATAPLAMAHVVCAPAVSVSHTVDTDADADVDTSHISVCEDVHATEGDNSNNKRENGDGADVEEEEGEDSYLSDFSTEDSSIAGESGGGRSVSGSVTGGKENKQGEDSPRTAEVSSAVDRKVVGKDDQQGRQQSSARSTNNSAASRESSTRRAVSERAGAHLVDSDEDDDDDEESGGSDCDNGEREDGADGRSKKSKKNGVAGEERCGHDRENREDVDNDVVSLPGSELDECHLAHDKSDGSGRCADVVDSVAVDNGAREGAVAVGVSSTARFGPPPPVSPPPTPSLAATFSSAGEDKGMAIKGVAMQPGNPRTRSRPAPPPPPPKKRPSISSADSIGTVDSGASVPPPPAASSDGVVTLGMAAKADADGASGAVDGSRSSGYDSDALSTCSSLDSVGKVITGAVPSSDWSGAAAQHASRSAAGEKGYLSADVPESSVISRSHSSAGGGGAPAKPQKPPKRPPVAVSTSPCSPGTPLSAAGAAVTRFPPVSSSPSISSANSSSSASRSRSVSPAAYPTVPAPAFATATATVAPGDSRDSRRVDASSLSSVPSRSLSQSHSNSFSPCSSPSHTPSPAASAGSSGTRNRMSQADALRKLLDQSKKSVT